MAVRRTSLKMVEPGDKGSEWRLPPRLYTFAGLVALISTYAPTFTLTPETRDEFYTNLKDAIKNINSNHLVLLDDFNARVSADLVDLIARRRLAACSRNVAICITRDYIVRQTKNLAFLLLFTTMNNRNFSTKLEVVHQLTYLGSTISDNPSVDAEINKPIDKVARTQGQLITHVWENPKLTTPVKIVVYNACIISTLL